MNRPKYLIYRLSARAVMGYSKALPDGYYAFALNGTATGKCKINT